MNKIFNFRLFEEKATSANSSASFKNLMYNKEIEIKEEHLKKFESSFEDIDEFLDIQIEEIYKFYDQYFSTQSFEIIEKFKILVNVLQKIDYGNIEQMKHQIESERKLIQTKKSEILTKKKQIEIKVQNIESKFKQIVSKDPKIIERHIVMKNLLNKNLKDVNLLKKSSEEVKLELNKILKEENKKTGIFKEGFNLKFIKKDLLEKQNLFKEKLRYLEEEISNNILKLNE